jgi:hypothetical protein
MLKKNNKKNKPLTPKEQQVERHLFKLRKKKQEKKLDKLENKE